MLSIFIYILSFVIIAVILTCAVIVHLQFGFHKHRKPEKSDEENRQTLHEMIFEPPQ